MSVCFLLFGQDDFLFPCCWTNSERNCVSDACDILSNTSSRTAKTFQALMSNSSIYITCSDNEWRARRGPLQGQTCHLKGSLTCFLIQINLWFKSRKTIYLLILYNRVFCFWTQSHAGCTASSIKPWQSFKYTWRWNSLFQLMDLISLIKCDSDMNCNWSERFRLVSHSSLRFFVFVCLLLLSVAASPQQRSSRGPAGRLRDSRPPSNAPQPGHPVRIPGTIRGRCTALQTGERGVHLYGIS